MAFNQFKNPGNNKKSGRPVKLKELALYYNIAVDRVVLLLNYFQQTPDKDETFWKGKFFKWKKQDDLGKKEINFETFAFLKNYLFFKKSMENEAVESNGHG